MYWNVKIKLNKNKQQKKPSKPKYTASCDMEGASVWEAIMVWESNFLCHINMIFLMFTNLNKYREQIFPEYAFYWLVGFCSHLLFQNNKTQVKNKKKWCWKNSLKLLQLPMWATIAPEINGNITNFAWTADRWREQWQYYVFFALQWLKNSI